MSYLSCSHSGVTRLDACDIPAAEANTVREFIPFLDVVSAVRVNILHLAEPMLPCPCSSRGPRAALYPPNPCEHAPLCFHGRYQRTQAFIGEADETYANRWWNGLSECTERSAAYYARPRKAHSCLHCRCAQFLRVAQLENSRRIPCMHLKEVMTHSPPACHLSFSSLFVEHK